MELNPQRYFAFARAHARATARGAGPDEALGAALGAELAAREPVVDPDDALAGMPGTRSLVVLDSNGLHCAGAVPEELKGTPLEPEAAEIIEQWSPQTTAACFARARAERFTPDERLTIDEPSLGWGGGWGGHAVLGYDRVLADGIAGVKAWVADCAERNGADPAAADWYRALSFVCDGIAAFIAGHGVDVGAAGAADFRQAVQLFWFIHVLDNTDSPGRVDQFLLPWYMALAQTPSERAERARPILDALWRKFIACRTWNVCLGGQTPDGRDATNELTYLLLDCQAAHLAEAPNLSVRLHAGSDPALLGRCVEVIGRGSGMPALYNDEVLVPALCELGIPIEHARDYAMNGCAQVDIQGLSHMGLEDGELNLAKCLELALRAGLSPVTGRRAGAATLSPDRIPDMATLKAQLARQIEHCTELLTRHANAFQETIARTGPGLFRSLFVDPCVERGRDIKRGGPLYNHGQFLTQGIANVGDSLCAIDRLVFRDKRMTLAQLVEVLDADWAGHESLRAEVLRGLPKFGNDDPAADDPAAWATECYFRALRARRRWGGGWYSGGVIVFNGAMGYGQHLAASADGRRGGDPVADSIGAAAGRDRAGPTALLRSVARLPQQLGTSAMCLNVKLHPASFEGEGVRKIGDLFATYFRLGGQQLQVNVVDAETLQAARDEPERHQDLVVRVGGYCARFVHLDPTQQDDIIARTTQQV
jgi:formate C-acetyltransferase